MNEAIFTGVFPDPAFRRKFFKAVILLADRIAMMTNGPRASIGDELWIELARPRDRVVLASDARFAAYRKQLLEFLFLKQRKRDSAASA